MDCRNFTTDMMYYISYIFCWIDSIRISFHITISISVVTYSIRIDIDIIM